MPRKTSRPDHPYHDAVSKGIVLSDQVIGHERAFPLDCYVEVLVERFRSWIIECLDSKEPLDKVIELSTIIHFLRYFQQYREPLVPSLDATALNEEQILDALALEFRKLLQSALLDFFQKNEGVFERLGFLNRAVDCIDPIALNAKLHIFKVVLAYRRTEHPKMPFSLLPLPTDFPKPAPKLPQEQLVPVMENPQFASGRKPRKRRK